MPEGAEPVPPELAPLAFAEPGARVFSGPATQAKPSPALASPPRLPEADASPGRLLGRVDLTRGVLIGLVAAAAGLLLLGFLAGVIAGRFIWLR